jgi:hypothetical protein
MDNELKFLNFDIGNNDNKIKEQEIKNEKTYNSKRRTVCLERMSKDVYRRAYSETQLLDVVDELKQGYSYNFITAGDVDAMSYIKLIIRKQKKLIICYFLHGAWLLKISIRYKNG